MMMVNVISARWIFKFSTAIAALLWLASSLLWAKGASVPVRNSAEDVINDLLLAGWWNSYAAGFACAAALATFVASICQFYRRSAHQQRGGSVQQQRGGA
jgi:hypothetical protein